MVAELVSKAASTREVLLVSYWCSSATATPDPLYLFWSKMFVKFRYFFRMLPKQDFPKMVLRASETA